MEEKNKINYMVAEIDNKIVFYHEAVWASNHGLIPKNKLVYHKDGNTSNNNIENLDLVDENKEHGDLHVHKIFHEDNYDKKFVKKHFSDVYKTIEQNKVEELV